MAFTINRGGKPHNQKVMKKRNSNPRRKDHQIQLSEEMRRLRDALREAESFLESEMAMRDLDRIIQIQERLEGESGT